MKTKPIPSALRHSTLLTVLAGCALAGSVSAQSYPPTPAPSAETRATGESALSRGDKRFLSKAAKIGAEEVQISRIAAQRSTNPQVREFAQKLVAIHESSNRDLTALATRKGANLPAHDSDKLTDWAEKKSADFDEDYVERMIHLHENAVDLYQEAATDSEDSDLAAHARKHLPDLQEHLRQARALEAAID